MKILQHVLSSESTKLTNLHPVLQRVYAYRGVYTNGDLDYGLAGLLPYSDLSGIEVAVDLLVAAIKAREHILIVADFDADGATSCALAIRGLRLLGAGEVSYVVPDRFKYGYGLTPEIVEVAAEHKPDLLVTVDNGIASVEGVAAAKGYGMQVLITDHHLPGKTLPAADAIVNPNQHGDDFASKSLAGVGVMFYVLIALRARLRETGHFKTDAMVPNLAQLLDLVALGTVADVVSLDRNNRILVSQGLMRIRKGVGCIGIRALAQVADRDLHNMTSSDLGFAIGPRLNAAGRMTDMSVGIECLLTNDATKADRLARELDRLNRERRSVSEKMEQEATQILAAINGNKEQTLPFGVCMYDSAWHSGVVGILASRLKEKLNRPIIIFADHEKGEIKGSARSVKGVHIRDLLDSIATQFPGLISKFGGHAMAAGLSLPLARFDEFKQAFDAQVRRHLTDADLQGIIMSDGALSPDDINTDLAEILKFAGPWGQNFSEPVFDGIFTVQHKKVVGEKHLKLILREESSDKGLDAIAFNTTDKGWPEDTTKINIVYSLDLNEFGGNRKPQMLIRHIVSIL